MKISNLHRKCLVLIILLVFLSTWKRNILVMSSRVDEQVVNYLHNKTWGTRSRNLTVFTKIVSDQKIWMDLNGIQMSILHSNVCFRLKIIHKREWKLVTCSRGTWKKKRGLAPQSYEWSGTDQRFQDEEIRL